MVRDHNQRGAGRVGLILTLAAVGVLIFVGFRVIPVRVAAYEFHETLREEARYAAVRDDEKTVAKRILDKAEELEIPLKEKNLVVRRSRNEVVVKASYEQPIDLKVMTYTYRFKAEERAPLF